MHAYLLLNHSARMSRGYQPGDTLTLSRVAWQVTEVDPQAQLADVFMDANADDRPNGRVERSACEGDVIILPDGTVWSIEAVGFRRVRLAGEAPPDTIKPGAYTSDATPSPEPCPGCGQEFTVTTYGTVERARHRRSHHVQRCPKVGF